LEAAADLRPVAVESREGREGGLARILAAVPRLLYRIGKIKVLQWCSQPCRKWTSSCRPSCARARARVFGWVSGSGGGWVGRWWWVGGWVGGEGKSQTFKVGIINLALSTWPIVGVSSSPRSVSNRLKSG
jgi:hypothetical protein